MRAPAADQRAREANITAPTAFRVGVPTSAPAPFLDLAVAGRSFKALLDTGASTSLIGDEVVSHLERKAVRLRARKLPLQLACGDVTSGGDVRLVVRWNQRVRRMRFVHLPGLTVPVILGRDFMSKAGLVVDVGNGGYREGPFTPLKPFAEPPPAVRSLLGCAAETSPAPREAEASGAAGSRRAQQPPSSVVAAAAAADFSCAARSPPRDRGEELCALLADASELTAAQRDRVLSLLDDFGEIFTEQAGCTRLVQHCIETGDAQPWKCNPRPVSPAKRQATDEALEELLKAGIIRRSTSPWGFPVVLVRKKDGSWRLCVDYRRLNAVTKKDAYPFPSVDEIVSNLGGAKYFSILDASKGYLQVEMRPGDECKTAFTCHRGLYEFVRMPFGLCGSPSTFQRLIDRVLGEAKWQHALAYLDDIVVYSHTFEEHLCHLRDVLEKLRSAGITINPAKAQICSAQVSLLGYRIERGQVSPDPEKLRAILEFPTPKDVAGVRRFLGMIGYYRQFIPACVRLQAPLTRLLRKSAPWEWGEEQENSLRQLAKAVADTASLKLPDLNRPFVIQTDASDLGVGAVLLQMEGEQLRPVAFASRALTPAERNYSVTEKECLAIIYALRKFEMYVEGVKFTVETDHMALTWLSRLREPSGRLARWALTLQRFEFEVRYRKGATNVVADALSRAPVNDTQPAGEAEEDAEGQRPFSAREERGTREIPSFESSAHVHLVGGEASLEIAFSRKELVEAQQEDLFCREVIASLSEETDPQATRTPVNEGRPEAAGIAAGASSSAAGTAASELESYLLDADGALLKYVPGKDNSDECFKAVIPRKLRRAALQHYHDADGHGSAPKTWQKLCRYATWPGMKAQVCSYVRTCHVCQERKPRGGKAPGLLQPIVSTKPWEILACDLMGPLPRSKRGYKFVLVVTCHFSGIAELYPLRKATAQEILQKLSEVFCRYGFPERLITDNATYFTSRLFREACAAMGVRQQTTSCYHPQSNVTERRNRDVKPLLGAYARRQQDWDEHLSSISFALRTSVNRCTGFTPAFLMFGRELNTPTDTVLTRRSNAVPAKAADAAYAQRLRERLATAIKEANRSRGKARADQKAAYDRAHRDVSYQVGDTVLKRNHALSDASAGFAAGLAPRWVGPFVVAERISRLNYKLKDPRSGRIGGPIHVGELKQYFQREETADAHTSGSRGRELEGDAEGRFPTHRYNTRSRRDR